MSNFLRIYEVLSEKPLKNADGEYYINIMCSTPAEQEIHEEKMHFDDYDYATEVVEHLKDIKGYIQSRKISIIQSMEALQASLDTANKMEAEGVYYVDFPVGSEDKSEDDPVINQSSRIH